MRKSLRARIFFGTVAVILAFVVLASWMLDRVVEGVLTRELEQDLVGARNACEAYLDLKGDFLASQASVMARDPRLAALLSEEQVRAEEVAALLATRADWRSAGHVFALGPVGEWLAGSDGQIAAPSGAVAVWSEREGLGGVVAAAQWSGIRDWSGRPSLLGIAPIVAQGELLGTVGFVEPIDSRLAFALRDACGRDVTVVREGSILSSAWNDGIIDDGLAQSWVDALAEAEPNGAGGALVEAGGEPFLATALPLTDEATVLLSRPTHSVLGDSSSARANLLLAACAVLLVALLVARGASARLGRPVRDLVEAANNLAGGDLDSSVEVEGDDEVAELGRQFNTMARQLRSLVRRAMEKTQAAEAAAEAKSAFVTTMSHELRTPLNAVLGFASLLQDTQLDGEQEEHVQAIRTSGQDLLRLLTDILEFTDLRAGRTEFDEVAFDVGALLRRVTDPLGRAVRQRGLQLYAEVDPDMPRRLVGRGEAIHRLLRHYVDNALKFTESGWIRVRLELASSEGRGTVLRGTVEDSGVGVPEEERERVFEPFLQLDSSASRQFGGTGLGLAICRDLTDALGGECGVESELGEGATFWFTAPVQPEASPMLGGEDDGAVVVETSGPLSAAGVEGRPHALPDPPAALPSAARRPEGAGGAPSRERTEGPRVPTILIVEDNPLNQRLAALVLRKAGWNTVVANHGREALERLAEQAFDLVLMDCQMPVMDGFEATRRIRENELGSERRTPILALTANAREADREACLAVGMDDFVAKPFQAKELTATIRSWLADGSRVG